MTKATQAPKTDPASPMKKPFIPYANPHSVTVVVWPVAGGNEIRTRMGSRSQIIRRVMVWVMEDNVKER